MDAPAPEPFLVQEVKRDLFFFNILAIIIDAIPFWVVCYANLDTVNIYFSLRSFILGASMNFMLACHIIFALEPEEYMDALFVSMVGMCLGVACAFIYLLRKALLDVQRATYVRHWMCVLILSLVIGSSAVLYGVGLQFHTGDEGWGLAIYWLAIGGAGVVNLIQFFQMLFGSEEEKLDIQVQGYALVMSFLATVDAWFFVAYACFLDTFGSLFSIISFVTGLFSVFEFVGFLVRMQ